MHIMHIIHMCAIVKIIVQHLTTYQSHLCVILVAMTKSCHSRISVCMCVHMHTYVYELVSPTTHESTFIMHHPVHMYTYHICVFFLSLTLHTIRLRCHGGTGISDWCFAHHAGTHFIFGVGCTMFCAFGVGPGGT